MLYCDNPSIEVCVGECILTMSLQRKAFHQIVLWFLGLSFPFDLDFTV